MEKDAERKRDRDKRDGEIPCVESAVGDDAVVDVRGCVRTRWRWDGLEDRVVLQALVLVGRRDGGDRFEAELDAEVSS